MRELLFGFTACLILTLLSLPVSAEDKSLRERLVASENTTAVIVVDDFHTLVATKNNIGFGPYGYHPTQDFIDEIISACNGQIEIKSKTRSKDLITDKESVNVQWRPHDGKERLFYRAGTEYVRCSNGEFEVIDATRPGGGAMGIDAVRNIVIKHSKPQPFVFKSEKLGMDNISTPADGPFKPVSYGVFEAVAKSFKQGGLVLSDPVYLYQYATALCNKNGGTMKFVVALKQLSEVEPKKAFYYIGGSGGRIFYACEGDRRFVIKHDGGEPVFASNRGLEGIDYVPLSGKSESANQELSQAVSEPPIASPVATGTRTGEEIEELSREVASKKTTLIKVIGAQELVGLYNGSDDRGCSLVSVKKNWDINMPLDRARVDTHNFRVCGNVVNKEGQTGFERLPSGIDLFVSRVAQNAQKYGSAEATYVGYILKGEALRDRDKCAVEVRILKDARLVDSRVVDGCARRN
ncbi:MAG: hypothetical protein ACOYW7_04925 [Nitrospirota bacterium]